MNNIKSIGCARHGGDIPTGYACLGCFYAARNEAEEWKKGFERYEKIRVLNRAQFASLCDRNLAGENFDEMVDALSD